MVDSNSQWCRRLKMVANLWCCTSSRWSESLLPARVAAAMVMEGDDENYG